MDSGRVYVHRTGTPSTHAASAVRGWTDWSSLPPKPPPHADGRMRTRSGAMPSTLATSSRSMYGVCVQADTSMRSSPIRRAYPASGSM